MRILQAPVNIANQAWLMAQGMRGLGHEVEVWQYDTSPFAYQADRLIDVGGGPRAYLGALRDALDGQFDVVHFHFAQSLVPAVDFLPPFWDLPVWRALRIPVVFTFHGTDIRQRSHHIADDEWSFYRFADIPCDEDLIADRLAVITRYATHTTVGSVLDLPYAPVGTTYLPKMVDTDSLEAAPLHTDSDRPIVAHAPSRRSLKGTDQLLAALDRLQAEGLKFEVDLIEGVSHGEAMARMARADIVVEKLLGGDAGVTSLEAMALGRVAVARIRKEVRDRHPDMPVVSADPRTFEGVMRELLLDPDRRARLGAAGRSYVEKEHSPAVAGQRLEELYGSPGLRGVAAYPGWAATQQEAALASTQEERDRARVRADKIKAKNQALRAQLKQARADARQLRQMLARAEQAKPAPSPRANRWRGRWRRQA